MGVTHYKTSIVTQYTMYHRPSITLACLEDFHSQVINNRYPINDSVLIENYLVIYPYFGKRYTYVILIPAVRATG